MKHWVLHFEDSKGKEVVRYYPQAHFPKWKYLINKINGDRINGNKFFNTYSFNGKCALIDLQKEKQKLSTLIGQLIY